MLWSLYKIEICHNTVYVVILEYDYNNKYMIYVL